MALSLSTGYLKTQDRDNRACGRLVVNVTPGFASVRFLRDGVEMKAARDHSGYRLEVGSYRVLATAPGYSAVESRVVIREHATEQLDLGLVPVGLAAPAR